MLPCANPPENQRVGLHVQVTFTRQKVQSEEAVVTPAFTDFKVRRKLPNDVLRRIAGGLMDHFHTVFIPVPQQQQTSNDRPVNSRRLTLRSICTRESEFPEFQVKSLSRREKMFSHTLMFQGDLQTVPGRRTGSSHGPPHSHPRKRCNRMKFAAIEQP